MFRMWRAYQTALTVHPTRTAMITTGGLMALGDALAQTFVEKRDLSQYDLLRTGRFLVFGTFLGGPMFSAWYRHLAKTFEGAKYAQVKMVACDQLGFAPPFLAFFLVTMEVMKGESVGDIKLKMKQDFPEVMDTNYKVWPAVQFLNFTFFRPDYSYITAASAPIHAFLKFFKPHNNVSKTMAAFSHNIVAMTIINPQKEYWPSQRDLKERSRDDFSVLD